MNITVVTDKNDIINKFNEYLDKINIYKKAILELMTIAINEGIVVKIDNSQLEFSPTSYKKSSNDLDGIEFKNKFLKVNLKPSDITIMFEYNDEILITTDQDFEGNNLK